MKDKPRGTALTLHSQAIRAIGTIEGIANYYEEKIRQRGDGFEIGDVMKSLAPRLRGMGFTLSLQENPRTSVSEFYRVSNVIPARLWDIC